MFCWIYGTCAKGIGLSTCMQCRIPDVLSPADLVPALRDCIAEEVRRADKTPLEDDDAYAEAFTQVRSHSHCLATINEHPGICDALRFTPGIG